MYAKIENGVITDTTVDLRSKFPNTSFPPTPPDEFEDWKKVTGSPSVPEFHSIVQIDCVLEGGEPVYEYTYEEIEGAKEAAAKAYRDLKAENCPYKGIIIKLTDGARADLLAMYTLVFLQPTIPDAEIMAAWQEPGYPTEYITALDLRTYGQDLFTHRQKCFSAMDVIHSSLSSLETEQDIIEALDTAYDNL